MKKIFVYLCFIFLISIIQAKEEKQEIIKSENSDNAKDSQENGLNAEDFNYSDDLEDGLMNVPKKEKKEEFKNYFSDFTILFQPLYFYPQDHRFRKIYDSGFMALIEMSFPIRNEWHFWADGGYFKKDGKVKHQDSNEKTKVYIVPVGLGLKYLYNATKKIDVFLKAGPNFVYIQNKRDYPNVKKKIKKYTVGVIAGGGCNYRFASGWAAGIFLNYLYDKKKIEDKSDGTTFMTYAGGIEVGGSFGYRF